MSTLVVKTKEFVEVDQMYVARLVKEAVRADTGRGLVDFDEKAFPELLVYELGRNLKATSGLNDGSNTESVRIDKDLQGSYEALKRAAVRLKDIVGVQVVRTVFEHVAGVQNMGDVHPSDYDATITILEIIENAYKQGDSEGRAAFARSAVEVDHIAAQTGRMGL